MYYIYLSGDGPENVEQDVLVLVGARHVLHTRVVDVDKTKSKAGLAAHALQNKTEKMLGDLVKAII